MATPAARTLQKRYTAGSCTLDVELQLSALSQWYPQPIAQDLQFKLWMNADAANVGRQNLPAAELVAEGDRAALKTLSQAVSQRVRGLLAIAHLNTPNANSDTNRSQPPANPSALSGLTLTQPLSYLQICDLSSVLYQCEQATPALPVSLSVAAAETAAGRLNTAPIDRPSENRPPKRNNVIPFAAIRRRPQLWASSAAAALLAVGLTTTLWPSLQSPSPELSTAKNSEPTNTGLTQPNALPQNTEKNAERSGSAAGDIAQAPRNAPPSQKAPVGKAPNSDLNSPAPGSAATAPSATTRSNAPEAPAERADEGDRNPTAKQPTPSNEPPPNTSEPNAAAPAAPNPAVPAAPNPDAARSANLPEALPPDNSQNSDAESFSTADGLNEDALTSSATASNQNLAQQDLIAIEQVQNYFQSQWQATASSQTLSYEVQLSETGEVVSFVALSEAAESYRDRILPDNQPLVFPPSSPGAGLSLQLDLLPNGQVQVYKL
jgi:Domain of unknown function (DUF4335)